MSSTALPSVLRAHSGCGQHVSPRVAPCPVRDCDCDAGEAREASSAQVLSTYRERNNTVILESYFDAISGGRNSFTVQYRTID